MTLPPYRPEDHINARFHRQRGDERPATPNERKLLAEVWKSPGITRSALGARLDITQQSIHRLITALEDRHVLRLGTAAPALQRGKPSPPLALNPEFACSVGLSINTDTAGVTVMDLAGGMVTKTLDIEDLSMEKSLQRIEDTIHSLLAEKGLTKHEVFGLGFAIAGFLVEGSQYNAPEPLAEWSTLHLAPYLSERLNLPVWTENGANTSTLYEQMFGIGQSHENFAYLSFNYGFGGGIIMNGQLVRGAFGNAGEFSGMFTEAEKLDRPRLRSLLEMLQERGVAVRTIQDLAQHYDPSWPGLEDWVDRVAPHTNRVINVLNATVDPELIVFGGQIPQDLADRLIERVDFYDKTGRHGIFRKRPRLVAAQMWGETAAMGAAMLPFKAMIF